MVSINKLSIFAPRVYRDNLGILGKNPCHNLYASEALFKIGKSDEERERERERVTGTRMKIKLSHKFEDIISVENLLLAWQEFVRGKRNKPDVQLFASALADNILQLHEELANKTYQHGGYYQFNISDPKPRNISKASVRDRLVHHAIYRILYPFFDRTFIADSYSCRIDKGTHRAVNRLCSMSYRVSKNNTRTCWVLKCDIKKFFASIDHQILKDILCKYIPDQDILWLLREIIDSFGTDRHSQSATVLADAREAHLRGVPTKSWTTKQSNAKIGLPLGNLTSQLFVNVYMNKFDQFVKHKLKAKYYVRYADDFVILSDKKQELMNQLTTMKEFLDKKLHLTVHPGKIILKTFASGVDFLGWIHFPNHRTLRTATKNRMIKRLAQHPNTESLQSYLGLLQHGNTYKLKQKIFSFLNVKQQLR